jgi:hypothetical protein
MKLTSDHAPGRHVVTGLAPAVWHHGFLTSYQQTSLPLEHHPGCGCCAYLFLEAVLQTVDDVM